MNYLKQSTAVDIALGPFLDETDGKTAETELPISQADVRLKKNDAAWAQKNEATTATHEENGWYEVKLDATDTNTLGILVVAVHEGGALPAWKSFNVVPANVYDSLFSTDKLQVDAVELNSNAAAAVNAEAAFKTPKIVTVGAGPSTTSIPTDLTSAVTDNYKGRIVHFISGALVGQATDITAYNGTTKTLTVTALTSAPAQNDIAVII